MYELSRTVPVNEPGKPVLTRQDVWAGLMMKANNALPYVPAMKKCEVVEKGAGWLLRDILLGDEPLRERVTFEPEKRVIFERVEGNEPGRIENILGEDEHGNLTLTFAFSLTRKGLEGNPEARRSISRRWKRCTSMRWRPRSPPFGAWSKKRAQHLHRAASR